MTLRETAPVLFVGLFTLAVTAIAVELLAVLLTRAGRPSPGLVWARRGARVLAPATLVTAGIILVWLSNTSPNQGQGHGTETSPSPSAPVERASVPITPDGVGAATVGATRAQVRADLPTAHSLGAEPEPYMVDLDGVPVTEGSDTLYVLLYLAGEPQGEDAPVAMVATTSTRARTAEDVGPGTSLAEARVRYGTPTLSYNVMDESREYARFPDAPGERILFRVTGTDGGFAGSYLGNGAYRETMEYDPAARISMVMVRLIP